MRVRWIGWVWLLLCLSGTVAPAANAQGVPVVLSREIVLPSSMPSGIPVTDQIHLTYYWPSQARNGLIPGVVILHPLGADSVTMRLMRNMAKYLGENGIVSAVVVLPYHLMRCPPGDRPIAHFLSDNVDVATQAYRQSAADASAVATWMIGQPGVDPHRIGVFGVSLGALVAHLVMGLDSRFTAGVAVLGGGNFNDVYRTSALYRLFHPHVPHLSPAEQAELRTVDPITYADRNRPRHVLMIDAARDLIIPPQDATQLWKALGRPPIQWINSDHFGTLFGAGTIMTTALEYFDAVWNGGDVRTISHAYAPTFKAGFLIGLDAPLTLAVQWQALTLGTRPDHMSLFHVDLGWSGRGPFAGVAVTVNPFIDVGVAHRFFGKTLTPYASIHLVF